MNLQEFQIQIDRLKQTFGEKAFPVERVKLIYAEGRDYPAVIFKQIVDKLIGECRFAPTLKEFRAAYSEFREKLNTKQKTKHANEAKNFWDKSLPNEEVNMIMDAIKKRVSGDISDEKWKSFMGTLKHMRDNLDGPNQCPCRGEGVVMAMSRQKGGLFAFRCFCKRGKAVGYSFPRWHVGLSREYEIA